MTIREHRHDLHDPDIAELPRILLPRLTLERTAIAAVLRMETGRERELVTLTERRLEQQPVISGDPRGRKPHMKGTASALRLAFGRTPGPDRRRELLELANTPEPVHVMDAYALVNMRLCSAVATGTTSSPGTPVMTTNCLPHLATTVRILEPTLCILQSGPARAGIDS